jgi:hypothetical protein
MQGLEQDLPNKEYKVKLIEKLTNQSLHNRANVIEGTNSKGIEK